MHSGVQSEVLPVLHLKARDFHYLSLSLSPLSPTLSLSMFLRLFPFISVLLAFFKEFSLPKILPRELKLNTD